MKKTTILLSTLFAFSVSSITSYGQESKRENVSLETTLGVNLVDSKAHGKMFGANYGVAMGVDFYKSGNLSIRTGLTYNESVFENHLKTNTSNHFVGIPVSVRLSNNKEEVFTPYLEFGMYGKSLVSSQTQYEKSKSFDGFTAGVKMEFGMLLKQSSQYTVGVKFLYEGDYYSSVKYQGEKYKFGTANIGLEFRLK